MSRAATPSRRLRLGTRRSQLALAQSGLMARALEEAHPGLSVDLVPFLTRGDRHPGDLAPLGGKGLFTEELEAGLLDGSLDLAVHSLKDLPVNLPEGLSLAAYPPRADPRDVLVSEALAGSVSEGVDGVVGAVELQHLTAGAVVLTGSLRRRALLGMLAPHLEVRGLRGNVDTRLRLWREQGAAGVVLAAAGLERLGLLASLPAHPLDPELFVPAPGQGTLAIEVRKGSVAEELARSLDCATTRRCARAERLIVAAMGGDCTLPLSAWARPIRDGETLHLSALLATPDGARVAWGEAKGAHPEALATACVEAMRRAGANAILEAIRGDRADAADRA